MCRIQLKLALSRSSPLMQRVNLVTYSISASCLTCFVRDRCGVSFSYVALAVLIRAVAGSDCTAAVDSGSLPASCWAWGLFRLLSSLAHVSFTERGAAAAQQAGAELTAA